MKVIVSGASGQLGRAVVGSSPDGCSVLGLSRGEMDLCDASSIEAAIRTHRPDVVINCGAYTSVDLAEAVPADAYAANRDGAENISRALNGKGCRLIHISTDFVFDGESNRPYRPDSEANPINVYGQSKLAGEQRVTSVLPDRSVIIRTGWLFSHVGRNFLTTMLSLMASRDRLSVVSDQVGGPTSCEAFCEVIWGFALRPDLSGVFHFSGAGVASWYDLAAYISYRARQLSILESQCCVEPVSAEEYGATAPRPTFSVLDCSGTYDALAISPTHWMKSVDKELNLVKKNA